MPTTLHHLALTAVDLSKSGQFFDALLAPLGYAPAHNSERLRTWTGPSPEILLYRPEGDDLTPHTHGRPGLQHAAFAVADQQTVLDVHKAVVAGGWTVVHEPREYPEYAPGYFAVFVACPSGLRVEVCHVPTPTH
ncbi:hypothetical protein [Catellatospora sichuanensis]|uniref:hypothetical protein n=1 Tax=Catellatospora sichuanensis TaxID=1969805 RepID=UPI001181FEFE|nr:hypothetical protein [Catellatospora sichuanensis]